VDHSQLSARSLRGLVPSLSPGNRARRRTGENMVALTGIEPEGCQFSPVQLGLSGCVFSTVGISRCSETPPRTSQRSHSAAFRAENIRIQPESSIERRRLSTTARGTSTSRRQNSQVDFVNTAESSATWIGRPLLTRHPRRLGVEVEVLAVPWSTSRAYRLCSEQ
jgi:hypothetical protein